MRTPRCQNVRLMPQKSVLESLLEEPVSTDFSRNSQQVTERLANPLRIPAEQPPSSASQRVAQKVAQKVAPEVRKKRGPGRPRKNQVASKETKKTVKKSPVTSRKRQRSNIYQGEAEFENSKLRQSTIYKDLGSSGTTSAPSIESSNSPPPNDIEDFVSAPTSSQSQKRRLTPDVSDNLPQSKRRRRQVETTQPLSITYTRPIRSRRNNPTLKVMRENYREKMAKFVHEILEIFEFCVQKSYFSTDLEGYLELQKTHES
ncbi:unnamed protein product [Trichogramma brassicae]|uniref:Uncharacterized protein n=1 Tax=Trichogramma brassicae TaxID=86971 RepID=A0A6H5HYY7_9HYME|nr:unnamed protein product [Trichogramma brassicae]